MFTSETTSFHGSPLTCLSIELPVSLLSFVYYLFQILYQWLNLGFRPQFIIYEALHEKEPVTTTAQKLEQYGYVYMVKKGWNFIFEFNEKEQKWWETNLHCEILSFHGYNIVYYKMVKHSYM